MLATPREADVSPGRRVDGDRLAMVGDGVAMHQEHVFLDQARRTLQRGDPAVREKVVVKPSTGPARRAHRRDAAGGVLLRAVTIGRSGRVPGVALRLRGACRRRACSVGSLLYFIDRYGDEGSAYDAQFDWLGDRDPVPAGIGFQYLDHLTHNVHRGNMDTWWHFYRDLFGFQQIHFFDIAGKVSGLVSRAITSPCGKIRIPLNERTDDHSQIESYLKHYKGEGIQHIAVGTDALYDAADQLAERGLAFMPGPPDTYYERSVERVSGHQEPLERLQRHGILIDGEGVIDQANGPRMTKILLQIFSKTVVGPIFFEFIQRKGDEGFGEGNFRALFESIEEEQLRNGELKRAG